MNELVKHQQDFLSYSEMKDAAVTISKSGLFPFWNTPEKVMTLMLLCKAENTDPLSAAMRYDYIGGRIAKRSQAMLDDFVSDGGKVVWLESTDKIARAKFTASNGSEITESYTIEDAKLGDLTKKDNWKKFPKQMLRARCISSGLRAINPGTTNFLYTPEETESFQAVKPAGKIVEPIVEAETESKLSDLSEDKVIAYLKSIEWIKKDISELTEEQLGKIHTNFKAFRSRVENFEA